MAYTVEFNEAETEIVILDDTGSDFDVHIMTHEGKVYLKQVNPLTNEVDLIIMTDTMYDRLMRSYHSEEGVHDEQRFRIQG